MPIEAAPTAPTIRESLVSAMETVVPDTIPAQETPPAEPSAIAAPEAPSAAPAQESEAEKAERLRNKDGTFAKGKPEPKAETAPVQAAPAKPKVGMPTSWKKELAPHWDSLPPEVQQNVIDREKQYATGVSTYKTEADRAKSVMQAIAPFEPMLQQAQIPVDKWIDSLGHAHRVLSTGTPQDKLGMIQSILASNRIPAQLAVQDAQGQWQLLGQQPAPQQPQQQSQQPVDVNAAVDAALLKRDINQMYTTFTKAVEEGKHPHYEEVKETMAGLLQSGLAEDYASAYEISLAMPKHRHLAAAPQAAPVQQAAPVVDKQQQAARARSQAVSVKSSTPSTMTQATGPKDLRGTLSDAFDRVTGQRV